MNEFKYKEPDKGHAIWGSEIVVRNPNKQALAKLLSIMEKYDPNAKKVAEEVESGEGVSGSYRGDDRGRK